MKSATLSLSHNLFLTRDERYRWYNGEDLEVVGVTLPVWFCQGKTSEPAPELFNKYKLLNRPYETRIVLADDQRSYEIHMSKVPLDEPVRIPDEVWWTLTHEEREAWYARNEPSASIRSLLDVKDGGSEWLAYRQLNKVQKSDVAMHAVHFLEIMDMQVLLRTIVTQTS